MRYTYFWASKVKAKLHLFIITIAFPALTSLLKCILSVSSRLTGRNVEMSSERKLSSWSKDNTFCEIRNYRLC